MKTIIKKITLRSIVYICLLALPVFYVFGKSFTDNKAIAEKVFDQTGKKVAGMVNGEPFFQEDLDVYVANMRAVVAAHYGQKYNLSGMGDDLWNKKYDGCTPREFLNKLALSDLVKNMVLIQEARSRGVDVPKTYNDLEAERTVWNISTDEVVFGPKTLASTEYNSYRISGITDELKTAMLKDELAPSVEQIKDAFESLQEEYKMSPFSASGIRFSWESGPAPSQDICDEIEQHMQQGFSPEEIVGNNPELTLEEFEMNSRYVSRSDEYEMRMAEILRDATEGSYIPDLENQLLYVEKMEGGRQYTFEEAPGLGRNKWINDKFEEFLEAKVKEAKVTLFIEPVITASVDLSKYSTVAESIGNGTLISRGKAAAGATTYYVDYNNGNDANNGTSPLKPWKTLDNVNSKTFNPGDHILLEANSIWNGTPADKDNYIAQAQKRGNGGMLAPQGDGAEGKLCVIDLYEIKEVNNGLTVYWSANRRPVINGNGTPSLNSDEPYRVSGTIQLEGQHYWEIRNIEATNSYDFPQIASNPSLLNTHWYKREVPKSLLGINISGGRTEANSVCKGILIENCYVHDVQSLHSNNRPVSESDWFKSVQFGTVVGNPGKSGGGIIGAFTESTVQGNIIRRVALEGLRTSQSQPGTNFIIRGNYIESVAGDGIVISNCLGDNLVESNLVKDACAAPNFGVACYASNWTYRSKNVLFQYNEGWGTLYGYWDGEAWDVDNDCDKVIYQYNYSHHNAGGAILFMNTQTNSIFRYNISANDGGGTESYIHWSNGQSLIHYSLSDSVAGPRIPLVYNNTFYVGDGVSTSIFGCVWDKWPDKYIRFYNNIILKTGKGEVRFSDMHHQDANTPTMKGIKNPEGFKNNLLYAYQSDRTQGDKSIFKTIKVTMDQWLSIYGNIWADPKLKIQETGNNVILRKQRDDYFPETNYNNPDKLKEYVSVSRLRMRASLFTPLAGSPAIEAGMVIPAGNSVQAVDGAWNGNIGALSEKPVYWDNATGLTKDMFGNDINASKPPIGGAVITYP